MTLSAIGGVIGVAVGLAIALLPRVSDTPSRSYVEFLPVTLVTSDRFARIAASLRRKGWPLPTNDIWIAAHAMESGAELLSFDRHFEQVDGIAWVEPEE